MAFSFDDATFRLGEKLVFAHTRWSVAPGEHWAVVGSTGAGKTLLARAVCRELPLVSGGIRFLFSPEDGLDGRPFARPGEILVFSAETHREFIRHFSDYSQARFQSFEREGPPQVAQVLRGERGRRVKGGLRAERARLVRDFGIEDLLHRPVHLLSHGESRKVFLVRLLLRSPRLLLLDDPYVGLDAHSREVFRQALERMIRDDDPQVILFTSRAEDIPPGIDHVLELNDCRATGAKDRARAQLTGADQPAGQAQDWELFRQAAEDYQANLAQNQETAQSEVICMRNVGVTYGQTRILDRVSWTVRAGERWALLGPNGAGKTTLLSLVLGDHPQAYANEIVLFGRQRGTGESIWEIKARQGWVSPELQIHFPRSMSSLDVVCSGYFDSIGLFRRPTPDQVERARAWLRALRVPAVTASFGNLSAGQQRLVLLARALVKRAPLLVLDEPLQGLDGVYRKKMLELIDRLCAHSSLTLIYVSHYSDEIPLSVTRSLWIERGRVLRET